MYVIVELTFTIKRLWYGNAWTPQNQVFQASSNALLYKDDVVLCILEFKPDIPTAFSNTKPFIHPRS